MTIQKVILSLLLLPILASAQSFNVFDIDTSEYPIMKAKFYSIDEKGDQILDHTTSDFEITENGNPAEVLSVSCPVPLPVPISVGIIVDTYSKINLARHGAERFVNFLNMPQNELAITYMNKRPLLFQDFTRDKQKARSSSKQIPLAPGGTSVSEMFFDEYAGGIELIKNREAQNRVLIFVSDLHCPNLSIDEQELIQQAKDNNIRIYTVLLNTSDYTGLFTRISDNTNGVVFENVSDSSEIEDIFKGIVFREQNDPCEIVWKGKKTCSKQFNITITNKSIFMEKIFVHQISDHQRIKIKAIPYFINFGSIPNNETKDTIIKIVALNSDVKIDGIIFEANSDYFEVLNSMPINLPNGDSIELSIRYNPIDTSRKYSKLTLTTDYCDFNLGLVGGSRSGTLFNRTLNLTHPNGGETFVAGTDTNITWKGITKNDKVELNFSIDNGISWVQISDSASDFIYKWIVPKVKSDSCLITINQNLESDSWIKLYGGSKIDVAESIVQTNDLGYSLIGYTGSNDFDIINKESSLNEDILLLKLYNDGSIEWQKTYGDDYQDRGNSILQTEDEGFLLTGYKTNKVGIIESDINGWVLKLDSEGEIEWTKEYGGSDEDYLTRAIETLDGSYLLGGESKSDDGDLSSNVDDRDSWLIKINKNGDIIWSKSYGKQQYDGIRTLINTFDGGYIISINMFSEDYDIDGFYGNDDALVIKIDSYGEIEWSKIYGGTSKDYLNSIILTEDNYYILAGYSTSINGLVNGKSEGNGWLLKINHNGDVIWSKTYDISISGVFEQESGELIIVGKNTMELNNYYIYNLNSNGDLISKYKSFNGGTDRDYLYSPIETSNNNYVLCGFTATDDFGNPIASNRYNVLIVKAPGPSQPLQSDTSDAVFSIIMPEPVIQNNDIDMGEMIVGNTKDTIVSSVICNIGDAPLHVLGVDITGGDDIDFLIPRGAGDFYLEKDECQDMMFEFTPSALGNRTAVATIRTTIGDFTDTINIRGEGINPLIEATTDVVDFGQFELGEGKDTNVVLIKNVGADDITITETKITGPDTEQFDMVPLPSFTLTSGEPKNIDLNYTAKYGGRTSSIIEFHYDGIGSPLRSMLFAEGIGGEVYPQVPDAYVGDRVELGLHLGRIKPEGLEEVATNFTATVSYNSTLLAPIDKNMTVTTENTTSFIEIEGQLSGVSQIATVPMKVGLGTAVKSGLVVTEFQLYDANGDSVNYEIEPGVGEFNVLGICEEGGTRLINPNGEKVGLRLAQNRLNTSATIYLDLIESGQTDLIIYDQLGNVIETAYSGTPSTGSKELNIDLSNYTNGRYYIKLTTPTITKTEIIEIVR
ncbi:MAG: choice-of-anchor D domain-containing protein [Chlorobiota bacterium]